MRRHEGFEGFVARVGVVENESFVRGRGSNGNKEQRVETKSLLTFYKVSDVSHCSKRGMQ